MDIHHALSGELIDIRPLGAVIESIRMTMLKEAL
jgi:hypothetical protein